MKRLIFHADDFNLTPGVNQGIVQCFTQGVVRSTSIMINLPGAEASAAQIARLPGLDVGLHVNLTMGRPVLPAERVPSLVDESGAFFRKPSLVTPRMDAAEAAAEIRAQADRAAALGIALSHLDSHHHLHQDPRIVEILIALARERGLAMRSYDEAREAVRSAGIPTPDHIIVEFYGAGTVTLERLLEIVAALPEGTSELCCHPAWPDERLQGISSYARPRADERDILCDVRLVEALTAHGVQIGSFAELRVG